MAGSRLILQRKYEKLLEMLSGETFECHMCPARDFCAGGGFRTCNEALDKYLEREVIKPNRVTVKGKVAE